MNLEAGTHPVGFSRGLLPPGGYSWPYATTAGTCVVTAQPWKGEPIFLNAEARALLFLNPKAADSAEHIFDWGRAARAHPVRFV